MKCQSRHIYSRAFFICQASSLPNQILQVPRSHYERHIINAISDEEEKNGYLAVAKSIQAYITYKLNPSDTSLRKDIEELVSKQTEKSTACVNSVRAFALSRLGLPKYEECKNYYRAAVHVDPKNMQWMFGLALVLGRLARHKAPPYKFTEDMHEEKSLYEKILSLDRNHALARSSLALCLQLKGEKEQAIFNAKEAIKSQPGNPYILSIAASIFRKAKKFDDAIKALEEACKARSGDTYLYHQMGLVYHDKYRSACDLYQGEPPDQNLVRQAIQYFTKAIGGNSTNTMALLDRARAYELLGMKDEADDDFIDLLATDNLAPKNKFIFNYRYALFLMNTCKDEEKAVLHFKNAIDCAVTHCIKSPVTRENPKPQFRGLGGDIEWAITNYRNIMSKCASSEPPERQSEGLKGLAWLYQALGEHDVAKEYYDKYLQCEGKDNDFDAICHLIKCLIQLDDLEGARQKIPNLETSRPDLAMQCTIDCALRQGEVAQAQPNGQQLATDFFREAVEVGSMEGCHKLADILIKNPNISSLEFRLDCVKILHCCKRNKQQDGQLSNDILNLMDLEHGSFRKLRDRHFKLELSLLENNGPGVTKDVLDNASQVITEARPVLDRVMIHFQKKNYPARQTSTCTFFHVQQDQSNQQKTEQQVKDEILKRLKSYKWDKFDTKFPYLLDFFAKIQPAYPGNTDNWYLALSQLTIREKHLEAIQHSQYHVPVILNGHKGVTPVPEGSPVYGTTALNKGKITGVDYELFEVVDVARKAAIEVERIVAEFQKYV